MPVKIRLQRQGKKNSPFYRVIAIDEAKKRSGQPLEVVGFWYPEKNDKKIDKKKTPAPYRKTQSKKSHDFYW